MGAATQARPIRATDGPSVTTPGRQRRGAVVGAEARARRHQKSGARTRKHHEARDYFVPPPSGGKELQHLLSLGVRRHGALAQCPFRPGCATSAGIIAMDRPLCGGRREGRNNVSPKGVHRTYTSELSNTFAAWSRVGPFPQGFS